MNDIEIKSLNSYYNNKKGIKNINLKVNNGEFILTSKAKCFIKRLFKNYN